MEAAYTHDHIRRILEQRFLAHCQFKLKELPDPNLFKDMKKACERITRAITHKQKIIIVGDYDVDGVVATAIMIEFFEALQVKVDYFIPNRFMHGYGLSKKVIEEISSIKDYDLIITVDNGITSIEAASLCIQKEIDLIITDHHNVGEILPQAYAIINPKQENCDFPYDFICGAQVAWYLCAGIKKTLNANLDISSLLDFVGIAIVSDLMPIVSLNFAFLKKSLAMLNCSNRPSIQYFCSYYQKNIITSDEIGFLLAPLLNSAGRLDNASIALDFLLSKNLEQAKNRLHMLDSLNIMRKTVQEKVFREAVLFVDDKPVIMAWGSAWNEGVIGIVASMLNQKYQKPVFVFSIKSGIAKGSARSQNIDLFLMIENAQELLIGFGGHKNAAGLTLKEDNLELLQEKFCLYIEKINQKHEDSSDDYFVITLQDINMQLLNIIRCFEPYGQCYTKPLFKVMNLCIDAIMQVGKKDNCYRLTVSYDKLTMQMMLFDEIKDIVIGSKVHIFGTINLNCYKNQESIQFIIANIEKA